MLEIEEHMLRGKMMVAREALRQTDASNVSKRLQSQKLFAKGFPLDTTEEEIFSFFGQFGEVNRVLMCYHKSKKFRGFAYVVMETISGFEMAIGTSQTENGLSFKNESRVLVSSSKSKEEMKKIHQGGHSDSRKEWKGDHTSKVKEQTQKQKIGYRNQTGSQYRPNGRFMERNHYQANRKLIKRPSFSSNEDSRRGETERSKLQKNFILPSSKIPGFFNETSSGDTSKVKYWKGLNWEKEPLEKGHSLVFSCHGLEYHNSQILEENDEEAECMFLRFNYSSPTESGSRGRFLDYGMEY